MSLFTGALLSLLGAETPCRALPLPVTATSESVQVPSLLLEDPVIGFVFPQVGLRGAGEIGSFGSAENVSEGVGARVAAGEHAFRYDLWSGVPAPARRVATLPAFQVGWSTAFRGTDVGVAYAWANEAEKARELREGNVGLFLGRRDVRSFLQVHVRRISLGLGRGGDRARIDVAFSLQREALEFEFFDEFRPSDRPTFSRAVWSFRVDDDYRPGGVVRITWRLSGGQRLLGFAMFQETSQEIIEQGYDESSSTPPIVTHDYSDRSWAREWSCGLAFEGALPRRGRWLAHASYSTDGDRWAYDVGSRRWARRSEELETLGLGLGGWMAVPGGLELRAGVSLRRSRSVEREQTTPQRVFIRTNRWRFEDVLDSFGWGLARSFEAFDLVGSMNTPPSPLHPIARLDIRFRL